MGPLQKYYFFNGFEQILNVHQCWPHLSAAEHRVEGVHVADADALGHLLAATVSCTNTCLRRWRLYWWQNPWTFEIWTNLVLITLVRKTLERWSKTQISQPTKLSPSYQNTCDKYSSSKTGDYRQHNCNQRLSGPQQTNIDYIGENPWALIRTFLGFSNSERVVCVCMCIMCVYIYIYMYIHK